jgi:hypothetical protein
MVMGCLFYHSQPDRVPVSQDTHGALDLDPLLFR